jgi:hypothetical protein
MDQATKCQFIEPTRYDNIIKSSNDKRDYRGLILHNKLKVLLVSDPTTHKSAASLDVNVGKLFKLFFNTIIIIIILIIIILNTKTKDSYDN